MSASIFNIDYGKLVKLLLPVKLRQPVAIAWLRALTWPVQQLYTTFKNNRSANLYRLKITSQVVYLQRLLNDRYDVADRRIQIVDAAFHDPLWLFTDDEEKPIWMYTDEENQPLWLFRDQETNVDPADFNIKIPADIQFKEPELRAMIDANKLPGKTYSIEIV